MNTHNPAGKDIRFIDSHYKDLFRIPDGGHIQIDYGDETVVKPCTFIDAYHTKIGNNVFHICQFAELMERNGNHYQAEPPIMGDEAAWKLGKDAYFAIRASEGGYDYSFFDSSFQETNEGFFEKPDLSITQARDAILADFDMAHKELRAIVFDELRDNVERAEPHSVWMEMASLLDNFAQDFDPYEYMDQHEDGVDPVERIFADFANGNTAPYREFLESVISESRDESSVETAKALRDLLDKHGAPEKPSVMEQLARNAEKIASPKPHKQKDFER